MRKIHIWLIVISFFLLILGVGTTVSYLVSSSKTVKNTFTIGFVDITLTETTGETYKIIPGAVVDKDPTVTVKKNSEECWLFVKIEKAGTFDTFCTYEVAEGWTALAGHDGVYYRKVEDQNQNTAFPILKDDRILVKDTVTEELLSTITKNPTLKFTAYAAQSSGLETAHDAWQILNS